MARLLHVFFILSILLILVSSTVNAQNSPQSNPPACSPEIENIIPSEILRTDIKNSPDRTTFEKAVTDYVKAQKLCTPSPALVTLLGDQYVIYHNNITGSTLPPQLSGVSSNEIMPQPGQTCGVAGDPLKNKCCVSSLQNLGIDTKSVEQTPIIGGPLAAVSGAINGLIDSFPFVFLPDSVTNSLPVPSVKKIKDAVAKIPPCLDLQNTDIKTVPDSQGNLQCRCVPKPGTEDNLKFAKNCGNITNPKEQESCRNCINGVHDPNNPNQLETRYVQGIWTGLGCIATASPKDFIENTVFGFGLGLAGIAAFLCIIFAAFQFQISQGNPEKLKKNQELLTSCIMGLMLIIFSVFILRLIGVTILHIPGLG